MLFELLLTVTGIGPKSALGILSVTTPSSLKSAIAEGNLAYLTKMSGIGKKTAEKILIELRDKVGVDRITWECDYPHSDSIWPDAPEVVLSELDNAGASDEDIERQREDREDHHEADDRRDDLVLRERRGEGPGSDAGTFSLTTPIN